MNEEMRYRQRRKCSGRLGKLIHMAERIVSRTPRAGRAACYAYERWMIARTAVEPARTLRTYRVVMDWRLFVLTVQRALRDRCN
jgi:hypothetical protein